MRSRSRNRAGSAPERLIVALVGAGVAVSWQPVLLQAEGLVTFITCVLDVDVLPGTSPCGHKTPPRAPHFTPPAAAIQVAAGGGGLDPDSQPAAPAPEDVFYYAWGLDTFRALGPPATPDAARRLGYVLGFAGKFGLWQDEGNAVLNREELDRALHVLLPGLDAGFASSLADGMVWAKRHEQQRWRYRKVLPLEELTDVWAVLDAEGWEGVRHRFAAPDTTALWRYAALAEVSPWNIPWPQLEEPSAQAFIEDLERWQDDEAALLAMYDTFSALPAREPSTPATLAATHGWSKQVADTDEKPWTVDFVVLQQLARRRWADQGANRALSALLSELRIQASHIDDGIVLGDYVFHEAIRRPSTGESQLRDLLAWLEGWTAAFPDPTVFAEHHAPLLAALASRVVRLGHSVGPMQEELALAAVVVEGSRGTIDSAALALLIRAGVPLADIATWMEEREFPTTSDDASSLDAWRNYDLSRFSVEKPATPVAIPDDTEDGLVDTRDTFASEGHLDAAAWLLSYLHDLGVSEGFAAQVLNATNPLAPIPNPHVHVRDIFGLRDLVTQLGITARQRRNLIQSLDDKHLKTFVELDEATRTWGQERVALAAMMFAEADTRELKRLQTVGHADGSLPAERLRAFAQSRVEGLIADLGQSNNRAVLDVARSVSWDELEPTAVHALASQFTHAADLDISVATRLHALSGRPWYRNGSPASHYRAPQLLAYTAAQAAEASDVPIPWGDMMLDSRKQYLNDLLDISLHNGVKFEDLEPGTAGIATETGAVLDIGTLLLTTADPASRPRLSLEAGRTLAHEKSHVVNNASEVEAETAARFFEELGARVVELTAFPDSGLEGQVPSDERLFRRSLPLLTSDAYDYLQDAVQSEGEDGTPSDEARQIGAYYNTVLTRQFDLNDPGFGAELVAHLHALRNSRNIPPGTLQRPNDEAILPAYVVATRNFTLRPR